MLRHLVWIAVLSLTIPVGCAASAQSSKGGGLPEASVGVPPDRALKSEEVQGKASWYGDRFHGRSTANGERYDMHAMTAAHKTFPFNTVVRVVRQDTLQSVIVRINDRGPFTEGRVIDLSRAAAEEVTMIQRGTAEVRIEVLHWGDGARYH